MTGGEVKTVNNLFLKYNFTLDEGNECILYKKTTNEGNLFLFLSYIEMELKETKRGQFKVTFRSLKRQSHNKVWVS